MQKFWVCYGTSMNTAQILLSAKRALRQEKSITTPDLDAEVLLAAVLRVSREMLFAHSKKKVEKTAADRFAKLIHKRLHGISVDTLLRRKEFFGLTFRVNKDVLTPRPETEILVEKVLQVLKPYRSSTIIDVGTGSGCIAIALRKNLTAEHHIIATDISEKALKVAQKNAEMLSAKNILWQKSDLLKSVILSDKSAPPLVVVANLPYIPTTEKLSREVLSGDPPGALFAGTDGLKLYRKFFEQLQLGIKKGGNEKAFFDACLFEFHPPQKEALKAICQHFFPNAQLEFFADLSGQTRFGLLLKNKKES